MTAKLDTSTWTVRDWLWQATRVVQTDDHGSPFPSLDQHEAALRACDAALRLEPRHREARRYKAGALDGYAHALARAGRHAEAAVAFEESRRFMPAGSGGRSYGPHSLRAWWEALDALERHADAVRVCDAYLAVARDEPGWRLADAHLRRAISLVSLDRVDEALATLDRGLAVDPTNSEAAAHRAVVLHVLGRYAEAVVAYDGVLHRRPTNDELRARRALALAEVPLDGDADAVPAPRSR